MAMNRNGAEPRLRPATIPAPPVGRMLGAQVTLLVLGCVVLALLEGSRMALSVLAGGGTAVAAQAWFARRYFRHRGARQARQVVQGLYRGAAGKWLLCVSALAVLMSPGTGLDPTAALLGFAGMQLALLVGLAFLGRAWRGSEH